MRHENISGLEMDELPQRNSNSGFLEETRIQEAVNSSTEPASKFWDWLRQLRVQFLGLIVGQFIRWSTPSEHRKVAMYKSRSMAAYNSLLHVIPLSGAITMLCLHWTWFYGDDVSDDSTILQFVAKFQELVMQISIVDVILCLVRREAVNGCVPLGALSGAVQGTQLSYLWSLDFISVFRSPAVRGWRKVIFVVIIPVLLTLTALVGPSTAVLMVPRPGTPRTDKVLTRYAEGSIESLYPSRFEKLNLYFSVLSNTIASGSYNNSLNYSKEEPYCRSYLNLQDISAPYQRLLRFCASTGVEEVINSIAYDSTAVNATIPSQLMVKSDFYDIFDKQSYRPFLNGSISVTTAYPVVGTQCKTMNADKNPASEVYFIQDSRISLGVLSNLSSVALKVSGPGESDTIAGQTTQYFPPLWIASPEADSDSTIVIFVTWFSQNDTNRLPGLPSLTEIFAAEYASARQTDLTVTTCTISAHWNTASVQLLINTGPMIIQSEPTSLTNSLEDDSRAIRLNLTSDSSFQTAEFHRQLASLSLGYETGLAAALAMALSEYPGSNLSLKLQQPPNSDSTAFTYTAIKYGWGYGQINTATRLSLIVVVMYCVIAVAYITYTIVTGHTSTAWNSPTELIVLALQSRKPDLGHVSVGIESLETLKQGVGIRANEKCELELVFTSGTDVGKSGLGMVKRNTAY